MRYNDDVIVRHMWIIEWHSHAVEELMRLPKAEQAALAHAVEKLAALGPHLPYPHQSVVKGHQGLRELRPRGGRSPWRALYERRGGAFVIAAVAPEAKTDSRGFDRAVRRAGQRLEGSG
jgi:hypothetical protein